MNPKKDNRISIGNFIDSYESVYVNENQHKVVADVAESFISQGIKDKDAFHVACAILAKCDYFITTDDRLLKCVTNELQVVNPMEFIRIMEEYKYGKDSI